MKTICFYFQIHQPFRLKRYRFFDIGKDSYYYDDFLNESIIARLVRESYIPALHTLLEMIEESGKQFKVAFSISGIAIEQFEIYAPEVLELLQKLNKTGCVEFLGETYAHSLSSLIDPTEFMNQVYKHSAKIESLFGKRPKVFRNTELIYSEEVAEEVSKLGFKGMLAEGAKHILGWKSPNYIYRSMAAPNLKLLMRNFKFSDDITFRFSDYNWSEYPLTADKYMNWIAATDPKEQVFCLFMSLDTLGGMQKAESGIFDFMKALPYFAKEKNISFSTPSEAIKRYEVMDSITTLHPFSWADEERDTTAWLGNKLQTEAFEKLYSIGERVRLCSDRRIQQDWSYLQCSDHFYYMSTKHFADGSVHKLFSPYESPFEAFTNYMNVLSDFITRVEAQYPSSIENEELNSLLQTIHNQADEIHLLKDEIKKLKSKKPKAGA